MEFKAGDRVQVETESTERPPRTGVIDEVVHGAPSPRYRISWDDGHESIYTPAAGALGPAEPAGPAGRRRSGGPTAVGWLGPRPRLPTGRQGSAHRAGAGRGDGRVVRSQGRQPAARVMGEPSRGCGHVLRRVTSAAGIL